LLEATARSLPARSDRVLCEGLLGLPRLGPYHGGPLERAMVARHPAVAPIASIAAAC
jgi:hypothetical protein